LGAKFLSVEGEGVKVEGGYAKEVSAEYLAKQKEVVNKSLSQADLVITTALVQGAKSPVLISKEQIESKTLLIVSAGLQLSFRMSRQMPPWLLTLQW